MVVLHSCSEAGHPVKTVIGLDGDHIYLRVVSGTVKSRDTFVATSSKVPIQIQTPLIENTFLFLSSYVSSPCPLIPAYTHRRSQRHPTKPALLAPSNRQTTITL